MKKLKIIFTEEEQKLYIVSFYSYLIYDKFTDFVVDLDDVWKWLGFSQKVNAKVSLIKNFKENIDYKISLLKVQEQKKDGMGGIIKKQYY